MNLLLRVLYLAGSDLESDGEGIVTIYQKRRSVETYYKTLKSHAALANPHGTDAEAIIVS